MLKPQFMEEARNCVIELGFKSSPSVNTFYSRDERFRLVFSVYTLYVFDNIDDKAPFRQMPLDEHLILKNKFNRERFMNEVRLLLM